MQELDEAEWAGFEDLQVKARESEKILFFYNRLNDSGPIKLWPHQGVIPVIATASTLAEVKTCLIRNKEICDKPIFIENGSAIVFPDLFLKANKGLRELIKQFAQERGIERKEDKKSKFLTLELTESVTLGQVKKIFFVIQRDLRKRDRKTYGQVEILPFIDMSDAELKKRTPLKTKVELRDAKWRKFAQPFWIEKPSTPKVKIKEIVQRLLRICEENKYKIVRGTRFRYLVPKGINEGNAAKLLQALMARYFKVRVHDVMLVGIGQSSQKESLFNKTNFSIHSQNSEGKLITERIINSTYLSVRFPEAVDIISRWLFKSLEERYRD
jgi:hydroxymethylpyrimidine pyrophosphatase-like HAD family hydrolase